MSLDRVVYDGDELDEIVVTGATVHLELLDDRTATLIIDRGPLHLHLLVQHPTVVETEDAEGITMHLPPLDRGGRAADQGAERGHEIVVTHDPISGPAYEVHCLEPADAPCRLICPEPGCGTWELVRGMDGPHHLVGTLGDPIRHDLVESGECNACQWINNDEAWTWELGSATSGFEVGRFPVRLTWTGDGCEWERA